MYNLCFYTNFMFQHIIDVDMSANCHKNFFITVPMQYSASFTYQQVIDESKPTCNDISSGDFWVVHLYSLFSGFEMSSASVTAGRQAGNYASTYTQHIYIFISEEAQVKRARDAVCVTGAR